MSPTGPHMFGHTWRRVAALLDCVYFTIDLDPRRVKTLAARGDPDGAAAYTDHALEQAGDILRTEDVRLITTTPPLLLQAIARHDDLVEVINEKVAIIDLSSTHLDDDTLWILRRIFPHVTVRPFGYGATMVLASAITRQASSEDDPVIHDTRSPYVTFSVIDPQTGRPVAYGARGEVVVNHISKNVFVPNNLERDTAIRVPGPDGQVGDSVSEVRPVETFEGDAVIKGVYRP